MSNEFLSGVLTGKADDLAPPVVDPQETIGAGRRRVRRRRSAVAGAAAVAVSAALLLPVGLDRILAEPEQPPATPPVVLSDEPIFMVGTELHIGDKVHDTGFETAEPNGEPIQDVGTTLWTFGWADGGFLVVDNYQDIHLQDGSDSSVIGQLSLTSVDAEIITDAVGPYAAWVGPAEAGARFGPETVYVYDTVGRSMVWRLDPPAETDVLDLVSIDGGVVYWQDERGLQRVDVATQEVTEVELPGASDVAVETILWTEGGRSWVAPVDDLAARRTIPESDDLSPDADVAARTGDRITRPEFFDVGTGSPVQIDLPDGAILFYDWVGDDRFSVLVTPRPKGGDQWAEEWDLWVCTLSGGTCASYDTKVPLESADPHVNRFGRY